MGLGMDVGTDFGLSDSPEHIPARPKAQCKWGRHCCRPHSHRRVDAPTSARSPANLRPVLSSAHAWRPMSGPCASAPCGASLRDSSPALAPASGFRFCPAAFHCARRPCFPPPCAVAWPRPISFSDHKNHGLGAFAVSAALLSDQGFGLSGSIASHPSQTSQLAFGRSLLHAVSRWARGLMSPPSLALKPLELQGLAAFRSRWLSSRRQVETAPESAI
jgi:hypothetical protein